MPRLPLAALCLALAAALAAPAAAQVSHPTPVPVPPPRSPSDPPIAALRIAARPLPTPPFVHAAVDAGVRAVLDAQVRAWNAGSVRGFMEGYAEADSVMFLSGATARRGWEEALYAYLRSYPDAAAMGVLSFDDVTVEPLSAVHALVWGRWHLLRDGPADTEQPGGMFTLLLVQTDQGWRIVHDHTS